MSSPATQRIHIRVEEPVGHSGARALHRFYISVNPLVESPPGCFCLLCQLPGVAPGTGADVDIAKEAPAWATRTYMGSGSSLKTCGWDSGLHSQGELNLSCVRLVGCTVQDCISLMERCLKFYLSLGSRCPWDT